MKQLNNFIFEKLKLNKDINTGPINKIDMSKLKNYTKQDIEYIIDWINNDMSEDIIPIVITNIRKVEWNIPESEIYLFYKEDYAKYGPYDIPYVRFYYDEEGLSVDIYDSENTKYYRSPKYKDSKDLDKCFDYIESKHKLIKELIK